MFGQSEVLVAAVKLCVLPGIFMDETIEQVEYFHLVFDAREIIYAESAPSESLFHGDCALKSMTDKAREELFALFPDLETPFYATRSACMIPDSNLQKKTDYAPCKKPSHRAWSLA